MSMKVRLGKLIKTTFDPGERFDRAQVDRWNESGVLTDDGTPYATSPLERLLYRDLPDAGLIRKVGRSEWMRLHLPDFDMSDTSFRGGYRREVGGSHKRKKPSTYDGRMAALRDQHGETLRLAGEGVCGLCGRKRLDCLADIHVDHHVPRAHGGADELGNLHAVCSTCNARKGTGTWDDAVRRIEEAGVPVVKAAAARANRAGLMAGCRVPEDWLATGG